MPDSSVVIFRAACAKVFKEKASGAKTDTPELARVIRGLEAGDVLIVTRLIGWPDRPAICSNVLDVVAKQGASFRSLKDAWADTATPHGRLMLSRL